MGRVLAYDLARLFIGPLFLTPRGIDRVDLALAKQIFADPDTPNVGILPTPWGVRAYQAPVVRSILKQLQTAWAETAEDRNDPVLHSLVARLRDGKTDLPRISPPETLTLATKTKRILEQVQAAGFSRGAAATKALPEGAVYLNIGQLGLAVPIFHGWLERRRDLVCAMMLHDVIPLDYPQYVGANAPMHHERMVQTAARHADCLIFNSAYARDGVLNAMARHGRGNVPNLVRSLPLPSAFIETSASVADLAKVDYFVVVSTIEPRKNHELLLKVWKRLTKRREASAPHLVIVGSLGFGAENILAELDASSDLKSRVHVVSGLSSRALASLVLGATGVLCPSRAEGFGLPVLEGNAMGVPTIASDIPAHREIASADTTLLPVDDAPGWEDAVLKLSPVSHRRRPRVDPHLTEAAYCRDLVEFLSGTDIGPSMTVRSLSRSSALDHQRRVDPAERERV